MLQKLGYTLLGCVLASVIVSGSARAEECAGTITAEEALKLEDARYAAQTGDDFAAMEKLFGEDLVYIHSNALVDNKAAYIESMRSGNVKYRRMQRSETKVRTYGCLASITGTANFDVTVKGQDISADLRFTTVWAKRASGTHFISWQATRLPAKQ